MGGIDQRSSCSCHTSAYGNPGSHASSCRPEKRGARDLSKRQVPVLLATAPGAVTAGAVLETVSQASLQAALAPVLATDAVLLSDGGRAYPDCARRLGVQHEAVNVPPGIRVRGCYPIQAVNHRPQQWRAFPGPFRGARRSTWTAICAGFGKSDWCARRPRVAAGWPQWYRHAHVSLVEPVLFPPTRCA